MYRFRDKNEILVENRNSTCIRCPSEFRRNVSYGKTRLVGLPEGEISLMIYLLISKEYTNVTDRQTASQPLQAAIMHILLVSSTQAASTSGATHKYSALSDVFDHWSICRSWQSDQNHKSYHKWNHLLCNVNLKASQKHRYAFVDPTKKNFPDNKYLLASTSMSTKYNKSDVVRRAAKIPCHPGRYGDV